MGEKNQQKAIVDVINEQLVGQPESIGKNQIVHKPGIAKALNSLRKIHHQKSPIIRELSSQGFTRSQIAEAMEIRYQHVRNVLITPLVGQRK